MAKIVTIPACRNPYVVIVNNKEYIYTGGETVEVPDEVAEVIEQHIEAQHRMIQASVNPSTGGGGLTDWTLVGEVVSDGTGDVVGISIPIDFKKWKEVYICANNLKAGDKNRRIIVRNTLAWHDGAIIANMASSDVNSGAYAGIYMVTAWIKVIAGTLRGIWSSNTGYASGTNASRQIETPRGFISDSHIYISLDSNNNGAIPNGETLTVYAR